MIVHSGRTCVGAARSGERTTHYAYSSCAPANPRIGRRRCRGARAEGVTIYFGDEPGSARPSTGGRLRLFVPPASSLQLNSDEWVWKIVEHGWARRTSVTAADHSKAKIIRVLQAEQEMPHISGPFRRLRPLLYHGMIKFR